MSNLDLKQRLIELLSTPGGLQRVLLVSGADSFNVTTSVNDKEQTLDLLGGNIAVLVLTPEELSGVPAGIYLPEVTT